MLRKKKSDIKIPWYVGAEARPTVWVDCFQCNSELPSKFALELHEIKPNCYKIYCRRLEG